MIDMIEKPFKISRSGLKLFLECPRCFWLAMHHKIKRPPGYPYTLSAAVDYLVKQEFDKYRKKGVLPPILRQTGLDAKLYGGEELTDWRNNFKGIAYYDERLNARLYGAVDDILEFPDGSLAVIDYKSTGAREVRIYDDYQKQMDIYTYILQCMGFQTHPNAYFVFYIVKKDGGGFDNSLPFGEEMRKIKVNTDWVGDAFERAVKLARQINPPSHASECDHCHFIHQATKHAEYTVHSVQSDDDYILVEEE